MNITAAWIAILIGFIEGAVIGLFFHKEDWLGGYSSWTRRLMRLGHISLFGLAFINIAFAWSVKTLEMASESVALSSNLFIIALMTMPLVCHGCAFYKPARHLFFIPVGCLIFGAAFFLYSIYCCGRVE